jgi:hypothetical protein
MGSLTTVEFRGDTLFAVERDDGVFVAVKPISERLGLVWSNQHRRIKRDPVLSEGMAMMAIPSAGGAQETTCLALRYLNGWLFGIDSSRVKPELRERVLAYQRECYDVLADHFLGPRAAAQPIRVPEPVADANQRAQEHKLDMVREMRLIGGPAKAYALWRKLGLEDAEPEPVPPSVISQALERDFLSDVVALSLQGIAEAYGIWTGTPAQLLAEMEEGATPADRRDSRWPRSAQGLGISVKRVAPLLANRGIVIERRHSEIRTITLRFIEG